MSVSSFSVRSQDPTSSEPLYQVKLLAALRSGDPALLHPFLADISKGPKKSGDGVDLAGAALHLAIRCASYETVELLLSQRSISPNAIHPPGSQTTPLHLAASLGRADVVALLLEQEGIDDTIRDSNGRTCKEVARGKEVVAIIQDSREVWKASYLSLLRRYVSHAGPPPAELVTMLESPRARLLDLSYLDVPSGTTLLHEAAKRKDLKLVQLAVDAGADVFVRDRNGRRVMDYSGRDDPIKAYLRQYTNRDMSLIDGPPSTTEPPELKGYLSKWTNVARGYNTRWFVLKDGMLTYYRHQEDENLTIRGSVSMKTARLQKGSSGDRLRFEVHAYPPRGGAIQKWYMKANHPIELARWTKALERSIEWSKTDRSKLEGETSSLHSRGDAASQRPSTSIRRVVISKKASPHGSISSVSGESPDDLDPGADAVSLGQSSRAPSQDQLPPHNASFDLHANSTTTQLELTAQLLSALALPPSSSPRLSETKNALKDSLGLVQTMLGDYVNMVHEREEWWKTQLEREKERAGIWEESLHVVVKEGEDLENELRRTIRSKKRKTVDFSQPEASTTVRGKPALSQDATEVSEATPIAPPAQPTSAVTPKEPPAAIALPPPTVQIPQHPAPEEEEEDTDEEDEFFDAIEAGTLPNLVITPPLQSPPPLPLLPREVDLAQYEGYEHPRERLPIEADNRPPVSLWAVLKGSIGKDLTRISFPVFFNEPTSMLQRMAEDMEFSECLDAAAAERDPHKRIAFVAAFAMSNYSSTIGRIAKPFNPMLGETFEYVRLDKHYRYVSEQVSHHPPISACWAESPLWNYFGEVDAQNKFMGKSFEIRPTGVAHAELKIPKELSPNSPPATGPASEGKVIEHYTWKKVTTNVSGFIVGSPTIDHYGDMIITNHRTKDTCVLTFKPRGWRGKDAYEIKGRVMDASGHAVYEIAGMWNSALVARASGSGKGDLLPNVVDGPTSPSSSPDYFLLWRNTEKPKFPFNLTPFAVTLNDCPPKLQPFLAPTDCRLRPDQRAFEMGRYDRANELKVEQEEFQRATRRKREQGELPPHKPRWFRAETDGDTGERVWNPSRVGDQLEYWTEREKVWRSGGRSTWNNVDPIFISAEL